MSTDPMRFLPEIWHALNGDPRHLAHVSASGAGALPSVFAVTDLAAASIGAASLAASELVATVTGAMPAVSIDRRLASFWFAMSIRPEGWTLPSPWNAIAGDYRTSDGWIRLHTNAPHHREAALQVLRSADDKDAVARAVLTWRANDLETAIVENNGAAAAMRTQAEWARHPQGLALSGEPLLHWTTTAAGRDSAWSPEPARPLRGLRVLDMTRVIAGPTATRFLASLGADVLRIDPPDWDEPAIVPEFAAGKRCARVDVKTDDGRTTFARLLQQADIFVHGYRADALALLGFDAETRRALRPGLIDISLDAYGWTGPWRDRRGFDSLVQMSSGIADTGMRLMHREQPTPLPVQALDHATGYLMAAGALRGLVQRLANGSGCEVRASLARTAGLLTLHAGSDAPQDAFAASHAGDLAAGVEHTEWGPARRLKSAAVIEGTPLRWDLPARSLGASEVGWVRAV